MFGGDDNRYIVFIQTKGNNNIPPARSVSYTSLGGIMLQVFVRKEGYYFRGLLVKEEDITNFTIYDLTFPVYKTQAINTSNLWKGLYHSFLPGFVVDIFLYFFVYRKEVNYFGNTITNNKPKYLVNIRDEIKEEMISRIMKKAEIKYEPGIIYINGTEIPFKKNHSITKDIMMLYFDTLEYFKHEVSFYNLVSSYKNNTHKYPSLSKIKRFDYETFRKIIAVKNEEIKEKFGLVNFLGINYGGISCSYYEPEFKNPSHSSVT